MNIKSQSCNSVCLSNPLFPCKALGHIKSHPPREWRRIQVFSRTWYKWEHIQCISRVKMKVKHTARLVLPHAEEWKGTVFLHHHKNGLKVDEGSKLVRKPSEFSREHRQPFFTSAASTSRRVSRGKGKKRKMKYGDFIKKEHFHTKESLSVIKRQPTNGRRYLVMCYQIKGSISYVKWTYQAQQPPVSSMRIGQKLWTDFLSCPEFPHHTVY